MHSYGSVVDIEELKLLLPKSVKIIEDCAEAHFASLRDKIVGSLSDVACYSFFANKIITTGEGGMCLSNNEDLILKIKVLRDHGMSPEKRYWHNIHGFNFRMTNIQAAIGCAQLDKKDEILRNRKESMDIWDNFFQTNSYNFSEFEILEGEVQGLWFKNLIVRKIDRERLLDDLNRKKVDSRSFFYPLSDMPPFKKYSRYNNPNAKIFSEKGLSLPVYGDAINNIILKNKLEI